MKKVTFLLLLAFGAILSSCNSGPNKSKVVDTYSFNQNCEKIIFSENKTVLYENEEMFICKESPGMSDSLRAYYKKCGSFTLKVLRDKGQPKGVDVGSFQGSMVTFNTNLPFEEVAKRLHAYYSPSRKI